MCEANAYVVQDDHEELVMEAVDLVEPEDAETFKLVSIFGEQKILKGRLVRMNLVDHRIIFEKQGGA